MKKALSIILALSLVVGSGITANAATAKALVKTPVKAVVKTPVKAVVKTPVKPAPKLVEVSKVGVVKSFTATSIVILEAGKANTYVINSKTKTTFLGTDADFMEVAKKGLKVNLKVLGNVATLVVVPVGGAEGQGAFGLTVVESRTNVTDSPNTTRPNTAIVDARTGLVNATNIKVENKEDVVETSFTYKTANKVDLGELQITPGTLKINLNGKELKVIEDVKIEFNPTDITDEVKLKYDAKTFLTTVEFEAPIMVERAGVTAVELQEDAEKVLEVSFSKKEYNVTMNEMSAFPIHEDVYSELNGSEVTLAKALHRGNYFLYRTNTNGEVIYIDAMYKDFECKVTAYDSKTRMLTITGYKFGNISFTETVKFAGDGTVSNAAGAGVGIAEAVKAARVLITTEAEAGYGVVSIQILK